MVICDNQRVLPTFARLDSKARTKVRSSTRFVAGDRANGSNVRKSDIVFFDRAGCARHHVIKADDESAIIAEVELFPFTMRQSTYGDAANHTSVKKL